MIGLAMPSRGRPDRCGFAIDSALKNARKPEDIRVLVAVDADDETLPDYEKELAWFSHKVSLVVGDFDTSVKGWNAAAAKLHADGADAIHMAADDLEYFKDWDEHVRAVVETMDAPWIMHYRDFYRDEARACNPFVSRGYYQEFGFLPPEVSHMHSDEWLEAMGRLSGALIYCPSLEIRHNHPKEGRASWDETYLNPRTPKRREADAAAWEGIQERLRHESARLRRMVQPKPWIAACASSPTPPPPSSSSPSSPDAPAPRSA